MSTDQSHNALLCQPVRPVTVIHIHPCLPAIASATAGPSVVKCLWVVSALFVFTLTSATAQTNTFPSSGNVGIGTTTPGQSLDVAGTIRTSGYPGLLLTHADGQLYFFGETGTAKWAVGSTGAPGDGFLIYDIPSTAERFSIDATNGNVGIGQNTPLDRLHINTIRPVIIGNNGGNGVYGSHIGFNATINTGVVPNTVTKLGGTSQQGAAIVTVDHYGNYQLQTYNAGSENVSTINHAPQFTFSNTGALGIGTTNPGAKVHVIATTQTESSTVNFTDTLRLQAANGADGAVNLQTAWDNSTNSSKLNFRLGYYTSGSQSRDALTIVGYTGNVGIGTTAPAQKLHIAGSTARLLFESNQNIERIILYGDGSGTNDYGFGIDETDLVANFGAGGGMTFKASSITGPALMRITGGGNVGIGTTNPTHKLAVNGTVRAKEVIVDTGWADYVFKKGYRLATLTEVEAHIEREGHLPGIPSAAEVAEHGVSMGEMQAKLLAKIEELTLHQIAQEKLLKAQQVEIAALRHHQLSKINLDN